MNEPFRQQVINASATAVRSLELAAGRSADFSVLDAVTGKIIERSLMGERICKTVKEKGTDHLLLIAVNASERRSIHDAFFVNVQQKHGAWFLPEQCKLQVGNANLPHYCRRHPRFACGVAYEERVKLDVRNTPDALYFWAVLEPIFELLFRPITLRSTDAVEGGRDEKIKIWSEVESGFAGIGIDPKILGVFRYGAGWSKLTTEGQLQARVEFLGKLTNAVTSDTVSAFRFLRIQSLVRRYDARARRGPPTMRHVLTKELQRTLSAYFSGDWLAFLRYVGEPPHPNERIAEALPAVKLYATASDRAAAIADKRGLSRADVEEIVRGFWSGAQAASPIEERVSTLQDYWQSFDDIHSKQASGMQSLWGLVEEGDGTRLEAADKEPPGPAWHFPGCYLRLLPAGLVQKIDKLWDGVCLTRYPDAIVTSINPHWLMADALGPALRFWHGSALTAWFVAEGPMSRTDMKGLAKYYARELTDLESLGFPISPTLFEELVAAEATLGSREGVPGQESRRSFLGITLSTTVMTGSRRSGFEKLRDVITSHRRAWTKRHFEGYLRARWELEIRSTAAEYNRLFEQKGRAPTAKQFAKFAVVPANHWFGGNVSDFYASFGEKSPVQSRRTRMLPRDKQAFMGSVFRAIGGEPTSWNELAQTITGKNRESQDANWRAHGSRKRLAELSLRYVQLREATESPPSLKEFGPSHFADLSSVLANEPETAWARYSQVVESILTVMKLPEGS